MTVTLLLLVIVVLPKQLFTQYDYFCFVCQSTASGLPISHNYEPLTSLFKQN